MPIETASVEHFFVVRWGKATPADCTRIAEEVAALRTSRGAPVLYLGIMPADMPPIDEQARAALMTLTRQLAEQTSLTCIVVEARGFAGAAMRAMMAGVMLVGGLRQRVKFVDSVATALGEMRPLLLADKRKMREAIERVGGLVPAGML